MKIIMRFLVIATFIASPAVAQDTLAQATDGLVRSTVETQTIFSDFAKTTADELRRSGCVPWPGPGSYANFKKAADLFEKTTEDTFSSAKTFASNGTAHSQTYALFVMKLYASSLDVLIRGRLHVAAAATAGGCARYAEAEYQAVVNSVGHMPAFVEQAIQARRSLEIIRKQKTGKP